MTWPASYTKTPERARGISRSRLVIALHFHQPFGNHDAVFEDALRRCYGPTLALLGEHPEVKVALHLSGSLLDWLVRRAPHAVATVRALAERGQVEVLGGADQEPIVAVLPERDAHAQLVRFRERCEALFGVRAVGMWLAERVWEPELARVLAESGYRYTLVDDSHLFAAGASPPLGGHYVAERAGSHIELLPIDRGLRSRIPFADVDEVIRFVADERRALVYGDDVEKFGLWPTTERRVWDERWLERFLRTLVEARDAVEVVLPRELLDREPCAGPAVPPSTAYAELGAWSLPTPAALAHRELVTHLEAAGLGAAASTFVRGGIWQGFLAKYPESRRLYQRMLRASNAVERARLVGHPRWREARARLHQGQCNCAYWHGLFGGLYLPHLRAAAMSALIEAEELVAPVSAPHATLGDHDGDGLADLLLEAPWARLVLAPQRGGFADALEVLAPRYGLSQVVARRREPYHDDVPHAAHVTEEALASTSAHDLVRATAPGLADKLAFDAYPRGVFVDHLLTPEADAASFDRHHRPLLPLADAPRRVIHLDPRTARVDLAVDLAGVRLTKRVELGATLLASHRLEALDRDLAARFASQVDIALPSGAPDEATSLVVTSHAGERVHACGVHRTHENVTRVRLLSEARGVDVVLLPEPACELWCLPIETVSRSERGFEATLQGTCLVFVWPASLAAGAALDAMLEVRA